MAVLGSFKDAIFSIKQRNVNRRTKAIVMAALFERAYLDRIKCQELAVLRFQDCDQVNELFPVFQKIEIGFHCQC